MQQTIENKGEDFLFISVDKSYVDSIAQLEAKCKSLHQAFILTVEAYPEDEAASPEQRIEVASNYFFLLVKQTSEGDKPTLIGFVNGTLAAGETLTHESMSEHNPSGTSLCVHSVVMDEKYRRRGLATQMLKLYINTIKEQNKGKVKTILLLCKKHLIDFYSNAGLSLVGLSHVQHGKDQWYEMRLDI